MMTEPMCRKISLQIKIIFKKVPAKLFVFGNSPWRDYFQKQNILQGPKTTKKIYRD